jgi:hypothetical protein
VRETAAPPQGRGGSGDELDVPLLRGRGRGGAGVVLRVRVLPAALLLTAVHLLITANRLANSWLWQDDFNLLAGAARRPLTGLLLSDYNGHLVPGSWALAWLFDKIAPLQWWPAALVTMAFVAGLDLAMFAVLRRLFGARPAILLPYAMFCATTLMLTSTLWWAAAMQWLPVTLSLLVALWFHLGYVRSGRWYDAVGVLVAVLFGLTFFEKALTTPLVLALVTVAYLVPGPLWKRPGRAFRRFWRYWLAQAALAGGFVALYLSRVTIERGPASKTADVVEVVRIMIFDTLLPSLIGGPLNWYTTPKSTIAAWPHPPVVLAAAAWILLLAAVAGSLLLVRGAWRAWVLLLVFIAVSVALVVKARLALIGPFIGRDPRYLTDAAAMVPLCLALAWLPLRDGLDAARSTWRPERPRGARRRAAGGAFLSRHRGAVAALATLAVVAMTAGGYFSGQSFMKSWTRNPGEEYFANLTTDLQKYQAAGKGPVYLFDDSVTPDLIMTPTFLGDRRLTRVTAPLRIRPVAANAVPNFSVVDARGHLHDAVVRGTDAVITAAACGTDRRPATVRLAATPGNGTWKLRLGYFTNRQTSATVTNGRPPGTPIRLERGLHQVFLELQGGGSPTIRIGGLDLDSGVCIGSATLGLALPAS